MKRRAFLKVLGAGAAVASAPQLFREVSRTIADPKDWVEDHGDFIVVRIPPKKVFGGETFDKPVLLLMGDESTFTNCHVNGFCNVSAGHGFRISNSEFNSSSMRLVQPREYVMDIQRGTGGLIDGCRFVRRWTDTLRIPPYGSPDFYDIAWKQAALGGKA